MCCSFQTVLDVADNASVMPSDSTKPLGSGQRHALKLFLVLLLPLLAVQAVAQLHATGSIDGQAAHAGQHVVSVPHSINTASPSHSPSKEPLVPSQLPHNSAHSHRAEQQAPPTFDFWILALFWPPAIVPTAAQSRARHAVIRQEAHSGFWTHGL